MKTPNISIRIRQAHLPDLPQIKKLYVETILHTCQKDYTPTQLQAWTQSVENHERWASAIENQYFLVAEMENTIVGFASLKEGEYIDFMFVHKDHLRKGIADILYQALEQEADRLQKKKLSSDVSKTAHPFFEKKGFVVEKENMLNIRGIEIVNYRMTKDK